MRGKTAQAGFSVVDTECVKITRSHYVRNTHRNFPQRRVFLTPSGFQAGRGLGCPSDAVPAEPGVDVLALVALWLLGFPTRHVLQFTGAFVVCSVGWINAAVNIQHA